MENYDNSREVKIISIMCFISFFSNEVSGVVASQRVNVSVGEPFMLECTSESDKPVAWYHISVANKLQTVCLGGEIQNGYRSIFQLDTTQNRVHVLKVAHALPKLSGVYQCVEDNGFGGQRSQFEVTIRRRDFSVGPSIVATVGDRVVIKCVTGLDDPVDWQYYRNPDDDHAKLITLGRDIINGNKKFFSLETTDYGDNNLIIDKASLNNSGIYQCVEAPGKGPGRGRVSVTVNMRTRASVVVRDPRLPVLLTCVTGLVNPPSWVFHPALSQMAFVISNKGLLAKEYENGTKFAVTSPVPGFHRLQIKNIDGKDEGTYRCLEETITSSINEANISLTIVDSSEEFPDVVVTVGEDKSLPCTSETHSSIEWTFCPGDGRPCEVIYNKLFKISRPITDEGLVLRNVSSSDAGYYICTDDDGFGEQRKSVKLSVDANKETSSIATTCNVPPAGGIDDNTIKIAIIIGVLVAVVIAVAAGVFIWLKVIKKKASPEKPSQEKQRSPETPFQWKNNEEKQLIYDNSRKFSENSLSNNSSSDSSRNSSLNSRTELLAKVLNMRLVDV